MTDFSLAHPGTLHVAGPVTVGSAATLVLRAPAITTTGELSAPGGTIVLESDSNTFGAAVTTGAGQGVVSIDSFSGSTLTVATADFTDVTTGILALGSLNGTSASGDITNITHHRARSRQHGADARPVHDSGGDRQRDRDYRDDPHRPCRDGEHHRRQQHHPRWAVSPPPASCSPTAVTWP